MREKEVTPPPKDEEGSKEWIENKLIALASLLGRLGVKPIQTLPGSIGISVGYRKNYAHWL